MDFSAAATLRSTYEVLKEKGIRMVFVMVWDDVRAELERHGFVELIGNDSFFESPDDMLRAFQQQTGSGEASGS